MKDLIVSLGLPPDVLIADKHSLDDEFERHPGHIAAVCEALAEAHLDQDRQKTIVARTAAKARKEAAESNDKKLLAKDLDLIAQIDPDTRKAERELQEIDYKVEMLMGLLSGLQAKTSALKHLSELFQASYYTTNTSRVVDTTRKR